MEWRLIISGVESGGWNMALDEALWRSFSEVGRPTLRLYRWVGPTLSLGRFQRVETVDLEECARREIEVVRRPTGGRAVLHDREVTYSLVHPLEEMGGVEEAHRQIAEALVAGLRKLGLAAELVEVERSSRNISGACFAAPTRFELTISGRKVAGGAQVRDRLALLEHGSLPPGARPGSPGGGSAARRPLP
ncbi:MAG: biotin/lipoate A/B protein ligase family protein [Candidatus Bipolaricaulia bacterium]